MVEHPGEYTWSIYGSNAQGESNEVLTPHSVYAQLGNTNYKKYVAYRELFRFHLEPGIIDEIRKATKGNYVQTLPEPIESHRHLQI